VAVVAGARIANASITTCARPVRREDPLQARPQGAAPVKTRDLVQHLPCTVWRRRTAQMQVQAIIQQRTGKQ
jgi:hypothetical protein